MSPLNCGVVRERGNERTSTSSVTSTWRSSATKSARVRVEWPMVKMGSPILRLIIFARGRRMARVSNRRARCHRPERPGPRIARGAAPHGTLAQDVPGTPPARYYTEAMMDANAGEGRRFEAGSFVSPSLSPAPGLGERSNSGRCEPERVDDSKVLKMVLRARPANKVLRNVEAGGRLRGSEQGVVDLFLENRMRFAGPPATRSSAASASMPCEPRSTTGGRPLASSITRTAERNTPAPTTANYCSATASSAA